MPDAEGTQTTDSTQNEISVINSSICYAILFIAADIISVLCLLIEKKKLINSQNQTDDTKPDIGKLKSVGNLLNLIAFGFFYKVAKQNAAQPGQSPLDEWVDKTSLIAVILSMISSAIILTNLFFNFDVEQQETTF